MPSTLPPINLAKDRHIPVFDRFMNWTLTSGRLIVIITEVVAVIAFAYRFSLDERLVDLRSLIKQKQNVISVLKNDESKYRNLQDRIAIASSFSTKAAKSNQTITDIVNLVPNYVGISSFVLNKDRLNMDIEVSSLSSLANLIDSLKKNPDIKSISIDNVANNPSVGLSVDTTIMLK